jgi:rhodanese-related sulfurtransferase
MLMKSTLRDMPVDEALAAVDAGAAFVDLRPVESYLEVHVPGSMALLYEFGPGLAARARDCLPLSLPLVLLDFGQNNLMHAAASFRGKGFTVLGKIDDGINQWATERGTPISTEIVSKPEGLVLDVGDPGASAGDDAVLIPLEKLWARAAELGDEQRVTIASGYGVRAALAVGILERGGHEVAIWTTNQ